MLLASVNAPFSTVVGVYSGGSVGGLAEITCRSPFVVRDATFLAQAGATYHIQVDGMFGQSGVVELRLEVFPPPPNDLFGNAAAIGALPFSDAVDLTAAGTEGGEASPSCATPFGGVSSSAWYRFTPAATGSISANTFSGGFSSVVAAYTGTSVANLTAIGGGVFRDQSTLPACGQLGSDPAHRREHHQQTVRRDRRRPTVPERSRGLQQFGSLTQFVPMNPKNGTTEFAFSYTFTADDARVGKVTFKAVANILGARDALPADNEAIAAPTNVSR